jgi:hypothetical protein
MCHVTPQALRFLHLLFLPGVMVLPFFILLAPSHLLVTCLSFLYVLEAQPLPPSPFLTYLFFPSASSLAQLSGICFLTAKEASIVSW